MIWTNPVFGAQMMTKCEAYSPGFRFQDLKRPLSRRSKSAMIVMAAVFTLASLKASVEATLRLSSVRPLVQSIGNPTKVASRSNRR